MTHSRIRDWWERLTTVEVAIQDRPYARTYRRIPRWKQRAYRRGGWFRCE